jgi:hypothetical protein
MTKSSYRRRLQGAQIAITTVAMASVSKRTSEILQELIDLPEMGGVTVDYILRMLGDRAFAVAILIFALPNSLPIPGIPGVSTLTGVPILFIAVQMLQGKAAIWLPRRFAERRISQANLIKMINKVMPAIVWLERYITPRWGWAVSARAERVLALLFIVLAVIIALPIPGGNFLPGLSMALIALGMVEKDGLFVACAVGFTLVGFKLMYTFIVLAVKGMLAVFYRLF